MKTKNLMVLDAEFNQPSQKCIQIGAAIFNPKTAELIATFETYIDPGESINPEIVQLTGITDQDVQGAMSIKEAYFELKKFHGRNNAFTNSLVWGSGVRNDSLAIWQEANPGEDNFMGFRVIDAKTIYQSIALHNGSQYAGGLKASMKKLGLTFEGEPHRALTDAVNTFKIWHHMLKGFQNAK